MLTQGFQLNQSSPIHLLRSAPNFAERYLNAQKELGAQKKTGGALGNIFLIFDFLVVLQLLLIPDNRLQYDYIPKQHEFPCEYSIFLLNRVSKTHCDA